MSEQAQSIEARIALQQDALAAFDAYVSNSEARTSHAATLRDFRRTYLGIHPEALTGAEVIHLRAAALAMSHLLLDQLERVDQLELREAERLSAAVDEADRRERERVRQSLEAFKAAGQLPAEFGS